MLLVSPNDFDAIQTKLGIVAHDWDSFLNCLRQDDSVERVAVMLRKILYTQGVVQ